MAACQFQNTEGRDDRWSQNYVTGMAVAKPTIMSYSSWYNNMEVALKLDYIEYLITYPVINYDTKKSQMCQGKQELALPIKAGKAVFNPITSTKRSQAGG